MMNETANRDVAWRRLQDFLPHAGQEYSTHRNYDYGPEGEIRTSRLSAAIQRRIVTEEEVIREVLLRHPFAAAEKFIQEVVWRTYWKGWLEWHPDVWSDFRGFVDGFVEGLGAAPVSESYDRALRGATGVEAFDFWREELRRTGYLHNHARMWFASIWIFSLKLPWQLGAKLFLEELLDADAASNTLSWRWVAGLQTRGKHYVARSENIAKYTAGRFPRTAPLDEEPVPLEEPSPFARRSSLPEFAEQSLPPARWGLLVHGEDLAVETTELGLTRFTQAALLRPAPDGRAPRVQAFDASAHEDASRRLSAALGISPGTVHDEADLRRWAEACDAVVLMEPAVGPLNDRLVPWLGRLGRPVWFARRTYDCALYPQATGGYFAFRKSLPDWVRWIAARSRPAPVLYRRLPEAETR